MRGKTPKAGDPDKWRGARPFSLSHSGRFTLFSVKTCCVRFAVDACAVEQKSCDSGRKSGVRAAEGGDDG